MPRISQLNRYGESSRRMERDSQLTHRNQHEHMELGASPLPSLVPSTSAAPPGVTPLPPTPAALPPAGLEAAEQAMRRRAEQAVDDAIAAAEQAARRAQLPKKVAHAVRPRRWARTIRTADAPELTVAEVLKLVRNARKNRPMAGARMVRCMAGSPKDVSPKQPADRTHAARRWTMAVVGRAVGLKQLKPVIEALRPIMAERARQAARKAAGL